MNKTLVETTVIVKDGETIVLGGLKKENKAFTRQGVPVLMDIPFIRKVFSSRSESIESTEIIIFITPHVIKDFKNYGRFGELKADQGFEASKTKMSKPAKVPDQPPSNIGLKLKE